MRLPLVQFIGDLPDESQELMTNGCQGHLRELLDPGFATWAPDACGALDWQLATALEPAKGSRSDLLPTISQSSGWAAVEQASGIGCWARAGSRRRVLDKTM